MDDHTTIGFDLNGQAVEVAARGDEVLLDTLRNTFGLLSVRGCCGIGTCGTCTVLLDGDPVSSCILLTPIVEGRSVTTADGLAMAEGGTKVQRAFIDARAFQCSYCIPAMTVTVEGLLGKNPDLTVDEAVDALGGHFCRCGSYPQVRSALKACLADTTEQVEPRG